MQCLNIKNPEVAALLQEYTEILGSENAAYYVLSENNGYGLDKAPNGAESKLFSALLEEVNGDKVQAIKEKVKIYTPSFKSWFGDWQNEDDIDVSDIINDDEELLAHHNISITNSPNTPSLKEEMSQYAHYIQEQGLWRTNPWDAAESEEDRQKRIQSIFDVAEKHGYIVSNLHKMTYLNFHSFFLIYEGRNSYKRTSKKDEEIINTYLNYLKETFPQLDCEWITQEEFKAKYASSRENPTGVDPRSNSFVKGHTVYLIDGKVNANIAIEEFLHPLITSMQYDNTKVFDNLLQDALRYFKPLVKQIRKSYNGYSENVINNEIVTQSLVRLVKHRYDTLDSNQRSMIGQFYIWALNKLKRIGKYIVLHSNDFNKITLNDLAKVITDDRTKIELSDISKSAINHNITISQFEQQKYAEQMSDLFSKMYNKYNKVSNKTITQQKIQDRIYEKWSELKTLHDAESLRTGLNFAIERIGIVNNGIVEDTNSIMGYFHKMRTNENGYGAIPADALFSMWDNQLAYFQEIDKLLNNANLDGQDWADNEIKGLAKVFSTAFRSAVREWREALIEVSDNIVDELVDKYYSLDDQNTREDVKAVTKDWLHKNAMYSDISSLRKTFFNYAYSPNPVIKLAFQLINEATVASNQSSLNKAYNLIELREKAGHLLDSWTPGNWEKQFMEYDSLGNPTGNFIRKINYGQFNIDRAEFMQKLKDDFIDKYGYYYYQNESGTTIRSNDLFIAEEEEWTYDSWGRPIMPTYAEWLLTIEAWECGLAHKRYTYEYYKERLSLPYNGDTDVNGNYNIYSSKGHGLSLRTLAKYNKIQSNINYYLDKCIGEDGFSRPEKLDKQDKIKLDYWQNELLELSNPYTETGELKHEDDVKCALEIQAWQQFIGEKASSELDREAFDNELNDIKQQVTDEFVKDLDYIPQDPSDPNYNNLQINIALATQDFIKYNSKWQIDPEFYEQTLGMFSNTKFETESAVKARYFRSALLRSLNNGNQYIRDISRFINNPQFFLDIRNNDVAINRGTTREESESFAEMFSKNFQSINILYTIEEFDQNGIKQQYLIDKFTKQKYNRRNSQGHTPMTLYQYVIDEYTERAARDGYINGLNDENGTPFSFTGMDKDEIKEWLISHVFTYISGDEDSISEDEKESHTVPLSIFTQLIPKKQTFTDKNGVKRNTVNYIPTGRFSKTTNSKYSSENYYDTEYDHSDLNGIQPKEEYYRNKDFDNMTKNQRKLYNELINTMKQAWSIIQPNAGQYQYFLPQIEGEASTIFSRLLKTDFKATGRYIWEALTGIQQNDFDYIRLKHEVKNADGTDSYDLPIRFVNRLKDPSTISSQVTANVILFYNMAQMFKEKSKIISKLNLLQNALAPENRNPINSLYANNSINSWESFNNMMKALMFERLHDVSTDELSAKKDITKSPALHKTITRLKSVIHLRMLGWNVISAVVGGGDSLCKAIRSFLLGKYGTFRDLAAGVCEVANPVTILNILRSVGSPKPTCKLVAMMQLNGVKGSFRERFNTIGHSKLSYWGSSNMLMFPFSMLDYVCSAIVLRGHYSHMRFYNGGDIEPGFYSRHEFIQKCKEKGISGTKARLNFFKLRKTMWDAYSFKNGELNIKPEYEKYINEINATRIYTKTHARTALYNGMALENDRAYFQTKLWGKFMFSMRNWMLQLAQSTWLSHGDDYNTYYANEQETSEVKGSKFKTRKRYTTSGGNTHQSDRSYNVATGEMNDQVFKELIHLTSEILKDAYYLVTMQFDKIQKLDYVTKYAIANLVLTAACMYGQLKYNAEIHNSLKTSTEKAAPSGYITSSGERTSNILKWSPEQWITSNEYQYTTNLLSTRLAAGTIDELSPAAVNDLVTTTTSLMGGTKTLTGGAFGLAQNIGYKIAPELTQISKDGSQIVKQGGFRGETEFVKNINYFFSPIKNLHSAFSPSGASSTDQYYVNTYKFYQDVTGNHILTREEIQKDKKRRGVSSREEKIKQRLKKFEEKPSTKRMKNRMDKLKKRFDK